MEDDDPRKPDAIDRILSMINWGIVVIVLFVIGILALMRLLFAEMRWQN